MTKIFISYRRSDSNEHAHHIADWLVQKYKRRNVFIDVDTIRGGADFAHVIEESIQTSDVVLVIIGDNWADEMHNRTMRPDIDFVRFEIHRAMSYAKYIIPVLLHRDVNLDPKLLPPDMQAITRLNYMYVRPHPDFHTDMERIRREIDTQYPFHRVRRYLTLFVAMIAFLGLLFLGITQSNLAEVGNIEEIQVTDSETLTPTLAPTNTLVLATSTPVSLVPTVPQSPIDIAKTPVVSNTTWQPYEKTFSGVPMVLVPAGCFLMGSESGESDEVPVHRQCFDVPFWINKYEVTNEQYGSIGCPEWGTQPNHPRTCANWYEARDYCALLGGRLPTEREWEYAARGPSNWTYPWGDVWNANHSVWLGNSNNIPAVVGSRPSGASWVGALDMSGNVWEWTSSLYLPYEYDGFHESPSDNISKRAIRGGAFSNPEVVMRTTDRYDVAPGDVGMGFRCVRSS